VLASCVSAKEMLLELSSMRPCGAGVAVPRYATVCGLPAAVCVIVSVALRVPAAGGLNWTTSVQLVLGAITRAMAQVLPAASE
jgi:hypothetical protein